MLFSETQRFRQPWIWIPLVWLSAFSLWGLLRQVVLERPWGTSPAPDWILILLGSIPVGLLALFAVLRLETEIDEAGVRYRFFPFHTTHRTLVWSQVEHAFVRRYRPLAEYGGWGLRIGLSGKGRALNVSGDMGLQLVLRNGQRLLIGTSRPREVQHVLSRLARASVVDHRPGAS